MDPNPLPSPEVILAGAMGLALFCSAILIVTRLGKIIELLESIRDKRTTP